MNSTLFRNRLMLFGKIDRCRYDYKHYSMSNSNQERSRLPKVTLIFILLLVLISQTAKSQQVSRDWYTGVWTTPTSWTPTWAVPITTGIAQNITINGYISYTGNIDFGGPGGDLIINDTLVINGNLNLGNNNNLVVNNNGLLIVRGNLTLANNVDIAANAYIVVTGNFTKTGAAGQGSFTSNDTPSKVFIGGTIDIPGGWASSGPSDVLNCNLAAEYSNSQCNYGNAVDVITDPINDFLQTTCTTFPSISTQPAGSNICSGNNASFTIVSTGGSVYQWQVNSGSGFSNIINNSIYSNASTATLNITAAPESMNGYIYRCVVQSSGGCITNSGNATLTVSATNTVSAASSAPSLCNNSVLTNITHSTTGATGIGSATGLPTGVTATWGSNTITISGTPTTSGTFNYSIPLTGGCGNISATGTITVNNTPVSPILGSVTQPTCATATGSFTITNYNPSYTYTASPSAGVTITGNTVTAPANSYTLTATLAACISVPSVSVTVNAQPTAPAAATASTTIQPTCAVATGTIVVSAPLGAGYEYNIDGGTYQLSPTFAGVSSGPHSILVRRTTDNTCISAPATVTVNAQPTAPAAATASTTIQPTCAVATGTIVVSAPLGAGYEYNIDGGTYQLSPTFAGVSSGPHSILVRRTTDNTCISAPATVTVNAQPTAPAAATASTTIQPSCAVATGTIVVSAPLGAGYEYNIDGGTYQLSPTFAGVSSGPHSILVRRTTDNTCISAPTSVTVNAQPTAPAAATASTTIQPTCAVATGTIVVSAPLGAGYEYNIDGGTYQLSPTFAGVSSGPHSILVRRTTDNTCISAPTSVTVNAQPTAPAAATASTTIQPTCAVATGTIVVSAPLGAGYEYNIDGGTYQLSPTFAGVSSGPHSILVRRTTDNTCISAPTSVTVNAQPTAPAAATASTTIQPTCAVATGTIVVSAPLGAGYEYNIDGGSIPAVTNLRRSIIRTT